MDFELSEEQATLREVSRSMLGANCPPALVRSLAEKEEDLDDRLWQRGTELGWAGLAVPEEHNGAGQGLVELCLVAEELGRAVAPGPFIDTALTALALARAGSPALTGPIQGLTERGMKASLAHHGSVVGTRDGDGLVLTGRAAAAHAAGAADWLLVTASLGADQALVLVETAAASTRRRRTLDETRGWYEVVFDGIRVPAGQVVTDDRTEVRRLLDAAAVLTAADALGVGERLLEMTVDYVKVREQFGRPLGSFQSVKHKVADMLTTLKGARAATYYAAMALDADVSDAPIAASVAKAFTCEGVSALAGEALQTHGGIGFTWEHDLHLYLRRAKVDEILWGAPAEHHERIVSFIE
jgi:alkylation response protein AidB-like acyl-CoA dehydrogenase